MHDQKIVFFLNNLGYGGAQKIQAFIANYCTKYYQEVFIVVERETEVVLELESRVKIITLPQYEIKKNSKYEKAVRKLKSIIEFRKFIKKISPDLICIFSFDAAYITILANLGQKTKVVGSERRAPMLLSKFKQIISKIFFGLCDGMVFQLPKAQEYYSEKIRKSSVVIPNPYLGIAVPKVYPTEGRKHTITTAAARFEKEKGIDTLLKAFAIVHEKHSDFILEIYGKGALLSEYQIIAKEYGITDYVLFKEPVKSVADTVYNSSVFVLPSRSEGIPNVLLEVLSAGVPTVSCNCPPGGPDFLTEGGRRGLLVAVDDFENMAKKIMEIIEDKDLSQRLSANGPEIASLLNPDKIGKRWINYFECVLER